MNILAYYVRTSIFVVVFGFDQPQYSVVTTGYIQTRSISPGRTLVKNCFTSLVGSNP